MNREDGTMADHDLNEDREQEQQEVKQPSAASDPNRKLRYYTPHEVAAHNQAQVTHQPKGLRMVRNAAST